MNTTVSSFEKIQHQLTIAFLTCMALGALSTFVNPALPVFFVIAYFAIGFFTTRNQKNTERFADSLYYMGFLLTLFALLVATMGDNVTERIIQNLGTGLSTTLAGLSLRVIMIQFRQTISDQEEEGQETLQVEVERLTQAFIQLTSLVEKFHADFVGQTQQFKQGIEIINQELEQGCSEMALIPHKVDKVISSAAQTLADKLRDIEIPADYLANRVDAAFAPVSRSFAIASGAIDATTAGFHKSLQNMTEDITEEMVQNTTQLRTNRGILEEAYEGISQVPSKMEDALHMVIDNLRNGLNTISFEAIATRQQGVVASLEKLSGALDSAASKSAELDQGLVALRASTEKISSAALSTASSAEAILSATEKMSMVGPAMEKVVGVLKELEEVAQNVRMEAQQVRNGLSVAVGDFDTLRKDISGVRDSTNALVEFASRELKR